LNAFNSTKMENKQYSLKDERSTKLSQNGGTIRMDLLPIHSPRLGLAPYSRENIYPRNVVLAARRDVHIRLPVLVHCTGGQAAHALVERVVEGRDGHQTATTN
jgi:hypothetical protein